MVAVVVWTTSHDDSDEKRTAKDHCHSKVDSRSNFGSRSQVLVPNLWLMACCCKRYARDRICDDDDNDDVDGDVDGDVGFHISYRNKLPGRRGLMFPNLCTN